MKTIRTHSSLRWWARFALPTLLMTGAWADDTPNDPWLPPAARHAASAPETRGAALQAQVERKLRESFQAADPNRTGTLTREQARAAGLGFIADHFERIDSRGTGRVSVEDVLRYSRQRAASR